MLLLAIHIAYVWRSIEYGIHIIFIDSKAQPAASRINPDTCMQARALYCVTHTHPLHTQFQIAMPCRAEACYIRSTEYTTRAHKRPTMNLCRLPYEWRSCSCTGYVRDEQRENVSIQPKKKKKKKTNRRKHRTNERTVVAHSRFFNYLALESVAVRFSLRFIRSRDGRNFRVLLSICYRITYKNTAGIIIVRTLFVICFW